MCIRDRSGSEIIKFADNTTFIVPLYKNREADPITSVIVTMKSWCENNKIHLNLQKTQIVTVKKTNSLLNFVAPGQDFITILGVTISDKLKWDKHVEKIIKKTSSNLFLLRKAKNVLNRENLIKIYYGLFDSIFNYCSPAFVGLNQHLSSRLQKQYNRAHNIICNGKCYKNCIPSPTERRLQASLKLLVDILSPNHILHEIAPNLLQRSKHLMIQATATTRRSSQFIPFTSLYYNEKLSCRK